jgi:hypothetical protein
VLHDAANQHHFAIADSVNVDFNRIVEETVQQYRRIVGVPAYTLSKEIQDVMREQVQKLAFELQVRGLMNVPAIADSVNVDFNRIVEETVQQYRRIVGDAHRRLEVATQVSSNKRACTPATPPVLCQPTL